jgi:hypothetical protein
MKRKKKKWNMEVQKHTIFYAPDDKHKCCRCQKDKLCRYMRTANQTEGWICKKCRKSNRRKLPVKSV